MEDRNCAYCGDEIPYSRNRNSKYCCNECYYENKKSQAVEINKQNNQERLLLYNERVIESLFQQYSTKMYILNTQYISAGELIKHNFNWSIYTNEVLIEGIKAKKLLHYAYTLFTNQTVRIWKL